MMYARTPEEVPRLFAEALVAGDLDALVTLYEEDATLVAQPGEVVTGIEAIREALNAFLATQPTFNLAVRKVLQTGDIALSFADWTLRGTGPESEPIEMAAQTSDVLRRQPYYAELVPEALDGLSPEECHRVYKMLRLKVVTNLDGALEVTGVLVEHIDFWILK